MRLLVLGATGGTGRELTSQAIEQGYIHEIVGIAGGKRAWR